MATKRIPTEKQVAGVRTGEAFGIRPKRLGGGYNPFLYAWVVNPLRKDKRTGATTTIKKSSYVEGLEACLGLQ